MRGVVPRLVDHLRGTRVPAAVGTANIRLFEFSTPVGQA
jgi:hypothetical protein